MIEFVVELNIKHAKEFSVLFVKQPPKSAGLRKHQPFVRRPFVGRKMSTRVRHFSEKLVPGSFYDSLHLSTFSIYGKLW